MVAVGEEVFVLSPLLASKLSISLIIHNRLVHTFVHLLHIVIADIQDPQASGSLEVFGFEMTN